MNQFYEDMVDLARNVVRGLSLALGFPENHLLDQCTEGNTISLLRLFRYFPVQQIDSSIGSPGQEKIGSSPHTDWGFLTLVLQDDCGGLQLFHNAEWIDVPPIPDTIVVNCGDYLSLQTSRQVISPLHRVMLGSSLRYSFVFFFYPSYHSNLDLKYDSQQGEQRTISLLVNQRAQESSGNDSPPPVEFGAFIADKWDQVYRLQAKRQQS
eukprot:c7323_g1_i5.p1 GENE.c7323_g1_i5~~c7323_g1_i5.p1  ORF type:complete len:209 (+),score=56.24 c7323_g1_i5:231-857(+)